MKEQIISRLYTFFVIVFWLSMLFVAGQIGYNLKSDIREKYFNDSLKIESSKLEIELHKLNIQKLK